MATVHIPNKGKDAPRTFRGVVLSPVTLGIGQIVNRTDWNARSKAAVFATDGPGEETEGLGTFDAQGKPATGLLASLYEHGQITPIGVLPSPKEEGVYLVVYGACRYEATKLLFAKGLGTKGREPGQIDAYIFDGMTDNEAIDLNVIENSARRDLKPADLAWGLAQMRKAHEPDEISRMVGKTETYVRRLVNIVEKAPQVAALWRKTPLAIDSAILSPIASLPTQEEQIEAWKALLRSKDDAAKEKTENDGDPLAWYKHATKKGGEAARILGVLVARGTIRADSIDFAEDLPAIAEAFKIVLHPKKKADLLLSRTRAEKLAEAMKKSYEEALAGAAAEVEDEAAAVRGDDAESREWGEK